MPRLPQRNRLAARIATCVAVGIICTVIVAWTAAATQTRVPWRNVVTVIRVIPEVWPIPVDPEWGAPTFAAKDTYLGGDTRTFIAFDGEAMLVTGGSKSATQYRAGVPLRSFQATITTFVTKDSVVHTQTDGLFSSHVNLPFECYEVPFRPIWPGLAFDTAFYGALAFLLWSAPGFVRRRRRREGGLCVGCGYELKGMQKCPECGA